LYTSRFGRAIAQAVSNRLPTTAALVRAHVKSCGICGGKCGTRADFLRVLRFPLPILISQAAPHSSSYIIRDWFPLPILISQMLHIHRHTRISSGAGTIGQLMADVPSGLKSHPNGKKLRKKMFSVWTPFSLLDETDFS
jgi:hypothetical protein